MFYYFTNPDLVKPQSNLDAFGPINNTDYQVNSLHNPLDQNGEPEAIAVVGGRICIVDSGNTVGPVTSPLKIYNLILQPNNQTKKALPFIKYFIYRGIIESSFIDSNGDIQPNNIASSPNPNATELTKNIRNKFDDQQLLNPSTSSPTIASLGATRVGTGTSQVDDNDFIDDLFYNDFPGKEPLLSVKAGEYIGRFGDPFSGAQNEFGFEIMLDSVGFNPTIGLARLGYPLSNNTLGVKKNENRFQVSIFAGQNSTKFQNAAEKQEVLNYLDPAAFYGSFSQPGESGISVKRRPDSNVTTAWKINEFDSNLNAYSSASDIYNHVLVGDNMDSASINDKDDTHTNGNFHNRNRVYLDIRDKFNNSYNFFREKDGTDIGATVLKNNIAVSVNSVNSPPIVTPLDYNDYEGGDKWPLAFLDYNGNRSSTSSNTTPYPNGFPDLSGVGNNRINIAFPVIDSTKLDAFIFVDNEENIDNNSATKLFRPNVDVDTFRELPEPNTAINNGEYTKSIALKTPSQNDKPISNYIKIRHIEHTKEWFGTNCPNPAIPNTPPTDFPIPLHLEEKEYLDFLFPMEMRVKWGFSSSSPMVSNVYYEGSYVNNSNVSGRDFMGNIGIAIDKNSASAKTTFFAYDSRPTNKDEDKSGLIDRSYPIPGGVDFGNATFLDSLDSRILNILKSTANVRPLNSNNPDVNNDQNVNVLRNVSRANLNDPGIGVNVPLSSNTDDLLVIDDFAFIDIDFQDYSQLLHFTELFKTIPTPTTTSNPPLIPPLVLPGTYVPETKVYLGLKVLDSGPKLTKGVKWIKFEITLKGYRKPASTTANPNPHVELVETPTGRFIYQAVDSFDLITSGHQVPTEEGSKGYHIEIDPLGPNAAERIVCNVYLVKAPNISHEEFCSYRQYYEQNVKHVWSTFSNKGLTAQIRQNTDPISGLPFRHLQFTGTEVYQQENVIDSQFISVRRGTPVQLRNLKENEVVLTVGRFFNMDRSITDGNQRQGTMSFRKEAGSSIPYTEDKNVPAHEFGHILGLADRYTGFMFMKDGPIPPHEVNTTKDAGNTPLFLPLNYDENYQADYRWMHNLMSTQRNVPLDMNTTLFNQSTMPVTNPTLPQPDYWNRMADFASPSNDLESDGNIFITDQQWAIILTHQDEVDFPEFVLQQNMHFLPGTSANLGNTFPQNDNGPNFGMFAGTLGGASVTDNNYPVTGNITIDNLMHSRITSGETLGYFSPYVGGTVLSTQVTARTVALQRFNIKLGTVVELSSSLSNLPASINQGKFKDLDPPDKVDGVIIHAIGDITTLGWNDFNNLGSSDSANFGRAVWNHILLFTNQKPPAETITSGMFNGLFIGKDDPKIRIISYPHQFTWKSEYHNRLFIIGHI